jgi:hypothetical protein
MSNRMRSWIAGSAAILALAALPGAIVTIHAPGVANADVCGGYSGPRVTAGGCAGLPDTVNYYVPPPAYYAPMPYDPPPPPVTGCASYNGRWVNAAGCR